MEAARVSRLRGHNVILAEAAPQLGGQVRIAALAPRHQGIGDYTLWQEAEIYRLGVDVRLSTYLDGGDADAFGADRSEEHTSELQSLMRISYAVFCLKKKTKGKTTA